MNHNFVIDIVRQIMKEKYNNFPYDCCHESSIIFTKVLKHLGIQSDIYYGKYKGIYHFWNKVNDNVIDLTLDQFDNFYGLINNNYYKKWYDGEIENIEWLEDPNEIKLNEDGYIQDINNTVKLCLKKLLFRGNDILPYPPRVNINNKIKGEM